VHNFNIHLIALARILISKHFCIVQLHPIIVLSYSCIQGHHEQQSVLPTSKSDACSRHARDSNASHGQCAGWRQE